MCLALSEIVSYGVGYLCALVEEGLVGTSAEDGAQGVAQILGEANKLQLLALVEDRKHRGLRALRHVWLNQALQHACPVSFAWPHAKANRIIESMTSGLEYRQMQQ